ncbi:SETD7 [Lepeophtheirus salmonis]|uniref:SETD7 n=1 Tax=Lepeophtheirus salmonis TaxID=72036 RepID=A0A7R8H0I0_LEPSM|nr:SETD7 [Lepeophtheirus salmonis]CAF2770878.1 SETD7 [Lepeophtheirus salmonis]
MSNTLRDWIQRISDPNFYPWSNYLFPQNAKDVVNRVCDPTLQVDLKDAKYRGNTGANGKPHGSGTLSFSNGDSVITKFENGVRHGDTVISSPRLNISRLVGSYDMGYFQGPGKIITTNTSSYECFFKDSVLHGPLRKIDLKKFREFRRQVSFIGMFKNGLPQGPCWAYLEGGGFLFAQLSIEGLSFNDYDLDFTKFFTSKNCAYIYPDFKTAYLGEFIEGVMKGARCAEVISVKKDIVSGILIPILKLTEPKSAIVQYFKSNKEIINDQPLVPDPYESRWIECRSSLINEAGEGLFAKGDIPSGTIVAFYNGVRIPYELGGPTEHWSSSGYKIFINADYESGERMNIPENRIALNGFSIILDLGSFLVKER